MPSGDPSNAKLIYFETSALDAIVKQKIPVSSVRRHLEVRGLTPCVGNLTLNECAQPILFERGDVARATFEVIRDLHPRFLAPPADLYEQEVRLLRDATPVTLHPSEVREGFERNEVDELAMGRINLRLLELVRERQKVKVEKWPRSMEKYLVWVKEFRRNLRSGVPKFRNFAELEVVFRRDLALWLTVLPDLRGLKLSKEEAELIAADIDLCPAIRATLYFWWNAMFICLAHGVVPSVDKVDDYRHVVEASYCNFFVTNDNQLLRSVSRFHQTLKPLSVPALI